MYETVVTIPGYIYEMSEMDRQSVNDMFRVFGSTRRRAYIMKSKGIDKKVIEHNLTGILNSRYVKDAYYSIEHMPAHITFGGKRLQILRESGKITKEEFHNRRNSIIISRGDKTKSGNLNMRIMDDGLRINIPFENRYAYGKLFIPKKYMDKYGTYLKGDKPYTITLKRDGDKIYAKISIIVPHKSKDSKRIMAVDTNAGHLDFTVMDKKNENILAVGKVKTTDDLHKPMEKLSNIANHYGADVVIGNLNTVKYKTNRHANRKVHGIPHYKINRILGKKLCERGRELQSRSEAYTTKVGRIISPVTGIDIHKSSSVAFAIKIINYNKFKILKEFCINEGDGSPSTGQFTKCGVTPRCQSNLAYSEGTKSFGSGGYAQRPAMGEVSILDTIKRDLRYLRIMKIS